MSWYIAKGIRVAEKTLLEQFPSGIPPFVEEVILKADHDAALRRAKAAGMDDWDMEGAALDGAMIGIAIGDVIMIAVIVYTLLY